MNNGKHNYDFDASRKVVEDQKDYNAKDKNRSQLLLFFGISACVVGIYFLIEYTLNNI